MKFEKEYSIEWIEECEADSFEEAEKIMDEQAENNYPGDSFTHGEVIYISGCENLCILCPNHHSLITKHRAGDNFIEINNREDLIKWKKQEKK